MNMISYAAILTFSHFTHLDNQSRYVNQSEFATQNPIYGVLPTMKMTGGGKSKMQDVNQPTAPLKEELYNEL